MSDFTVNPTLTPQTPHRVRRVVENDEYAAFLRRILRAYSRRIAAGDVEALAHLAEVADELHTTMHTAVTGLRAYGYSWADIARPLGITRQAAQQRFGGDSP
ncbi:hypothetical protein [Actinomadura sp. 9N215]|uniref:hypothetical protein n=1 Tax=Actinomadura sp. 9N215 TaxID=3375150 RepID=UPI0037A505D8